MGVPYDLALGAGALAPPFTPLRRCAVRGRRRPAVTTTSPTLETLVSVVLDDLRIELGRPERDRAATRGPRAPRGGGGARGGAHPGGGGAGGPPGPAAEEASQRDADREIRGVVEGAFERLAERFLRRVRTALEGLRDHPAPCRGAPVWARSAGAEDGPSDRRAGRRLPTGPRSTKPCWPPAPGTSGPRRPRRGRGIRGPGPGREDALRRPPGGDRLGEGGRPPRTPPLPRPSAAFRGADADGRWGTLSPTHGRRRR